jgi:hypothetical protein
MNETKTRDRGRFLSTVFGVLMLILFSPLLLVVAICYGLYGLMLYIAIWSCWCLRGRYILLVYSNSPIWFDYIEKEIMPHLKDRAVILNWTERNRWKKSIAVLAFRHFGGERAFNPMVTVFQPFHFAKVFRFFEPFQEYKHGQPAEVEKIKTELFDFLNIR